MKKNKKKGYTKTFSYALWATISKIFVKLTLPEEVDNTWFAREKIQKAMENKRHVVNKPLLFKVENGNYIPTNKEGAEIPRSLWNKEQKTRYFLNSKSRNFLMRALIEVEYENVHSYKSSKEMWYFLALAYEGVSQMFGRFQTIINNIRSLGKTYDNYNHIKKFYQVCIENGDNRQREKKREVHSP
ncbi:hypothetical protein CR513_05816, partial [Mucuna pruriens]